ncbi:hypothetical protein M8J76_015523 [Diaphorina citri]|nr:hypothetical protein M8J76_015523 [Diaphorina citri]
MLPSLPFQERLPLPFRERPKRRRQNLFIPRPCGGGITVQTRECRPAKTAVSKKKDQWVRVPVLSKPQCFGVHKRIHVCNKQKCPYKVKDPRQVQCEEFNGKRFMDQSYMWEPFLGAPNDCALNCRAVGHMFYATLSPSVQDGVSCRPTNASFPGVCIAGKCQFSTPQIPIYR